MALNKDELKEKVFFHLINFSSEKKPLSSEYFYKNLCSADEISFKPFQRILADVVGQIIVDQMTYQDYAVCSCNEGYFIPRTEEGFQIGKRYLASKIDEVQQRIRFIDQMRLKKVYGTNANADIFSQGV